MYMNGVKTGSVTIAVVHRLILRDLHMAGTTTETSSIACAACTAFFVAVAGAAARGAAGCRIVSSTFPAAGTATTVFASPFSLVLMMDVIM